MASLPIIEWALEHLNYLTIMLLMAIESSFIPFPSEVVVPPAAYMVASGSSDMTFGGVVLFATLGALIGAFVNYLLGVWLGRPLVHRLARSRAGAFLLLSEEKVVKAESYFVKHGAVSTLVGRLVPGIRQLISIPAGMSGMKVSPFILYTVLGAGAWNLVLASIGWYLESVVPREELMPYVERYSHEISLVILGIVILALLYMTIKAFRRPKGKSLK